MASNIDATKPETGNATTSSVRDNFSAAKTEIEALQAQVGDDSLPTHIADTETHGATGAVVGTTNSQTLTNKTLTSPDINGGTIDGTTIGATTPAAGTFTTLASSGTHTVGNNSSGNSATLQQASGFQFKLNGDTGSQLGTVSWVNNSGATTANAWATGDSSGSGVFRLKGVANVDIVPGNVAIDGTAGYRFSTASLAVPNADGPAMLNEAASSSNPTFVPDKGDGDTGVGANGAGRLYLISDGTARVTVRSVGAEVNGGVFPTITETYDLGSTSLEWDNLYLQNAATVSDERRKENIGDISWATDFLRAIDPKAFTLKDTEIKDEDGKTVRTIKHGRPHTGVIAQQLIKAMEAAGVDDWAAIAHDKDNDTYHVRYLELIGVLLQGWKDVDSRLAALEGK